MNDSVIYDLFQIAWTARERAFVLGPTKVGCAVIDGIGNIYSGCNIEHRYRCHDIHAEINAISTMISNGGLIIKAVFLVAERDRFTPCGGCMDWIMQFSENDCDIYFQSKRGPTWDYYTASQIMPFYPR